MPATGTTVTPTDLAREIFGDDQALAQAKRVRGWLRSNHPRAAELKAAKWALDADVADAVRARFAKEVVTVSSPVPPQSGEDADGDNGDNLAS